MTFGIRAVLSDLGRRFWTWIHDIAHGKLGPGFIDEDQVAQGIAEWLDQVRHRYGEEVMLWFLHSHEMDDDIQDRSFRDIARTVRDSWRQYR